MDRGALAIARDGIYSQAIATDVSGERLERFFRHDGDHYRVVPEIRGHIVFTAHDLLRDPPFSRQQLISCRHVLRYLDRERQAQVMNLLRYACARHGCLFLGSSEQADDSLFDALDAPQHIYRARADARIAMPRPPERRSVRGIDARAAGERPAVSRPSEMHAEALEEIAPPTVLLDGRWNVLHMSATVSRFFEQSAGPLAVRVTDLVRPELRHPLHVLLLRAAGQSSPQVSPFVVVRFEHTSRVVAMVAQPRPRPDRPPHVLLTFLDMGETARAGPDQAGDPTVSASLRASLHAADQRIENLREEGLFTTEELRVANEEMQSLTEEFHSTTEELETSKEELQSTNEELQTVNQELNLKLDELSRAHSDLENLMAATNIATLFLGCDLRIRWFTRQLADLFTIKPRDLDRPIGDLRHSLNHENFEADARHVLETLTPIERQMTSVAGRVYVARLSPYRTAAEHAVDGVVITFVDVTVLMQAETALRDSQRQLESELAVIRHLHAMTLSVATAPELSEALERLVVAAVELHGADQGHVQLHDRETGRLQIVAHAGCAPPFLARFKSIPLDDGSTFAEVLRTHEIAQIPDVVAHESDPSLRRLAAESGYRAVQATPLINRAGQLLGVLSVHFRDHHQFTERDLQLSTLLGRQASDLIDARLRQLEVSASKVETSEVRRLLGRLVLVQEEERRRVARDVHDQLGQPMTALRMQMEALGAKCGSYPALMAEVSRTMQLAAELDDSIDFLTWELRPAALDRLGLSAALADLVRGWSERFHQACQYHAQGADDARLPQDVAVNLYRIVQEGLHNVQKHAGATHVSVLFAMRDTEAVIVIEDDGQGFTPGAVEPSVHGGLGLVGMRERAWLIGGEIAIEAAPGRGTSIFVKVPCHESRPRAYERQP
jgi:signal transduction histidine kinase